MKGSVLKTRILSKLFKYFWSIYWSKINIINIKEEHIPKYATWITNDIISKIIKNNWDSVSIDMSDNNIKYLGLTWNMGEYEKRKSNITECTKTLLEEISSYITSQWWSIKIYRNWQEFSSISNALNSIPIFS